MGPTGPQSSSPQVTLRSGTLPFILGNEAQANPRTRERLRTAYLRVHLLVAGRAASGHRGLGFTLTAGAAEPWLADTAAILTTLPVL